MHKKSFGYFLVVILFSCLSLVGCGGGGTSNDSGDDGTGGQTSPNLEAPQVLSATALDSNSLQIEWDSGDEEFSNVVVEISIDGHNFSQVYSASSGELNYVINGLIASTEYYVRVRGVTEENSSVNSNIVTVTTDQDLNLSCEHPQGDSIYFVDIDGVCGSCSDEITKIENTIDNAWCSISHAASVVEPGDTIYIRAGEYKESVTLSQSGEVQAPIIFAAYAGEEVILEGGNYLNGWIQCSSASECGGNSNWQNIYYSYIPVEDAENTTALVANLFQGDEMLVVSQEPDMPDPFYVDDIENYYSIDIGAQTLISLTDADTFSGYEADFWEDAYALMWVTHNRVEFRKIDSYDNGNHVITFAETDAPAYDDREGKYSIYNGVHQIDNPGEYSVNYNLEQDGTRKVYLWPFDGVMSDNSIRYSARNFGININRQSYVTIQGLKVQRYTGSDLIHGVGIGSVSQGGEINGIIVKDNDVRFNRHATRGYGGIYLSGCNGCVVESNTVTENVRNKGIFLTYPIRTVVENNVIYKPGQTGISYYYAEQSSIINNEVSGCSGSHANTITVYLWSNDVLIANNYIHDSLGYITLQRSNNITIYSNIVDASISRIAVNEFGDESSGTWIIANNTFINSDPSTSIIVGNYGADFVVKNNIIDGFCPPDGATVDRDNNIYTGLMWCQSSQYGWQPSGNEIVQEDLAQILINPSAGNYIPLTNGYSANAGQDISDILPSNIFTDFDFDRDFAGNSRDMGSPSVGALEPN